MAVSNQTCNATLPGQIAGSTVKYRINAVDTLQNSMTAQGNYTVKKPETLNITVAAGKVQLGENVTVNGVLTPASNDSVVSVQFSQSNSTKTVNCLADGNGTFTASFKPDVSGQWAATATCAETQTAYRADSQPVMVTVTEPPLYIKYSLFIIIGLLVTMAAGGAVYFLRIRNR